jgi:hypothetical protein
MATILTAHQPSYLPWLGFFHKLAISDVYVSLDNVQFEKNSYVNRNKVKIPNGVVWLTVPVMTKGHFSKTISDLKIDNSTKWRIKHWKTLQLYQKAAYFENYRDFFEEIYEQNWELLVDLNEHVTRFFLKELGIDVKFLKSSELNLQERKSELIIEMCEKLNANMFVFGVLGKDYVNTVDFESRGIKAYFQEYNHPTYPQIWGDFVSHLSVVDLLFNVGPEKAYEVIMRENIEKDELTKMLRQEQA